MSNHVSSWLYHPPVLPATVDIRASATDGGDPGSWYEFHMHDDGNGHLIAPEITGGVIDYDTGAFEFTLANGGDFVLDLEPVWYYHNETFNQFPFSLAVTVNQA
ncbi:MAG: hypothetical protein HZA50_10680 [Planctomycetes bacterium]|nr:hypothetical protein [Planctomycetota bacterium]